MESPGSVSEVEENRVKRDYQLMRVELLETSTELLRGYTEADLNTIEAEFHAAQLKVLSPLSRADRKAELSVTLSFERRFREIKCQFMAVHNHNLGVKNNSDIKKQLSCVSAKLPKIEIKPFDGNIENWISFIQLFESLVHNREMSNVEKLHYLLSSVKGTAYNIIKNFPLSDGSYPDAYNALHKYYNRKRQIAFTYYGKILNCESIKSKTSFELERVHRTFTETLSNLDKYQLPDKNFMLFHLLWSKLDRYTREAFQLEFNSDEIPLYEDLLNFIEKTYRALDVSNIKSSSSHNIGISTNNFHKGKSSSYVVASQSCLCCAGKQHNLESCNKFLNLSVQSRFDFVKERKLCLLCFSPSHLVKGCRSGFKCEKCNYSHNSLLHFDSKQVNKSADENWNKNIVLTSTNKTDNVLFGTAKVLVTDCDGNLKAVRVLLDCASASNFVSESCAHSLGLLVKSNHHTVSGIGNVEANTLGSVSCQVRSMNSEFNFDVEAFVLPSICSEQPMQHIESSSWSHLIGLTLADPDFNHPGPIDMLLNADIFSSSLLPGLRHGRAGQPHALNTSFGWILMGGCDSTYYKSHAHCEMQSKNCFFVSNLSLDNSLKRFWELENIGPQHKILSKEDQLCEEYFTQQHRRTPEGRFVVPLPFVEPLDRPCFENTRAIALKRFSSIEKKLQLNPEYRKAYVAFMKDYETCHHLEQVEPPVVDKGLFYYIPHHGILRPESVSTPLRVVFDASCSDSTGKSLNHTLLPGPKLQTNIFDLLIRFRWHAIVFTGDVKQMYRQILVPEADADYQRILWRPSINEPVRDYRLRTVTYGVSSAPYQALRTIAQLAQEASTDYPLGSAVLTRDIFVDDVVSGADSISEAIELRSQLCQILSSGGFDLRKWTSNHRDFFVGLSTSDLYSEDFKRFEDISDVSLKILGLSWLSHSDCFRFKVFVENRRCTKRTILSELSRIYDPLGFLGPVTFYLKYLVQLLWISGVSWDEDAPETVVSEWLRFKSQLSMLSAISIPRRMVSSFVVLQIHGFSDASERGMCGIIFVRVVDADGCCSVYFCASRCKLAPLRKLSIPRLELQAAVLLSDLMTAVVEALSPFHTIIHRFAWSDSTVTLSWIKSCPSRWKTYVANRVSHIQERVAPELWRHVGSLDNPADVGSRGILPSDLVEQSLWWNGPSWLSRPEAEWPVLSSAADSAFAEDEQKILTLVTSVDSNVCDQILNNFSSFSKVKRVLAYVFRFLLNSRPKRLEPKLVGALSPSEIRSSFMFFIKHVQRSAFSAEIDKLKSGFPNSLPKSLRKLAPFLDEAGHLRVGGRLAHASVDFETKHALLLPRDNRLTYLIIDEYHRKFMHPGAQTLQNLLAQHFWILSPKRAIRAVVSQCTKCFRVNPKPAPAPIMGNLPEYRVNQIKPFSTVNIDFGGPFDIALGRGRGVKTFKGYICVIVCTSTKAIHLELTSELSTEAFLAALKRFVARRGRCSKIVSDQGRNFVGASNYLGKLMKNAAEIQEIQFAFSPPGSPHFNGLAEAGIKSVKTHISRVVGTQRLTFEEFYTVLAQIEALLNSRPLTPLSSDANDFSALTPGHFLTLEPLSMLPEEQFVDLNISPLNRWKLLQKMHQDFWRRWHQEYVHTLQQRMRWNKIHQEVAVGTLVLIVNEQCNPMKWSMGRIVALHKGTDGVCRVATVKTATSKFKRPLVKLCPLPILH